MTAPTLASVPRDVLRRHLGSEGVCLRIPPFTARIRSPIPIVGEGLATLYAEYELLPSDGTFADFHVAVVYGRRFPKALCVFEMDGLRPFTPLAVGEAFAFLEWGLNWCVTGYCHTLISIHAAVLERHGRVLIMPAPPGSGKSTLCAALLLNGWRLLSDEMALLDPRTGLILPAPRPVSLKNQSIEIIRQLAPHAIFGPLARDTMKGTVAHMRVPSDSLARAAEPALPGWLIFPRYLPESPARLVARAKSEGFMQLAENSFNQNVHGRPGFEALSDLVARSDCYDFTYSRLAEAIEVFDRLPLPP
ncbi:HPr kinase [Candidatus Accumulibacter aalborgensis]|uniref:HPr kinase n=1 Tax=Candidatus Accumulibacter aalborgensis TaxID=1860102 RepID=A0A1A8XLE1_9PROT|nr:HprK-related kinase A [Candidatus Accumulibacter aalborgensis]SBT05232.1 HPr kinase [Candidatus Accumulibacter aalborgensis]